MCVCVCVNKSQTLVQLVKVGVRREVIVSAGALSSPQILMLSGVGPRDHLAYHKVRGACLFPSTTFP